MSRKTLDNAIRHAVVVACLLQTPVASAAWTIDNPVANDDYSTSSNIDSTGVGVADADIRIRIKNGSTVLGERTQKGVSDGLEFCQE
ncbi:MAG: hypothetical protein KDA91_22910 [Planctomycetaceae bacterium]|nr:hypothetical protein [Planctomycetaceae bacterium]